MKNWFKFLIALLAGILLAVFLPKSLQIQHIYEVGAAVSSQIVRYIFYPFLFITFISGVATLRKQNQCLSTFLLTILWALISTVSLVIVGGIISWKVFPVEISGIVSHKANLVIPGIPTLDQIRNGILSGNIFALFGETKILLPALMLLSLLLGIPLKPDEDYMRPAFSVMNSFSEAFYRLAQLLTQLLLLGMVFFSAHWLSQILLTANTPVFTGAGKLLILTGIITLGSVLLIFPLILIVYGKPKHPYSWLWGLFAPALLALFSGSALTAAPTAVLHTRYNLNVAKRVSSTATPLLFMISKSGTALISIVLFNSLYPMVTGKLLTLGTLTIASGLIVLFSLISFTTVTVIDIFFVIAAAGAVLKIDFLPDLVRFIPLLPILGGAAAFVNTYAAGLGAGAVSKLTQASTPPASQPQI